MSGNPTVVLMTTEGMLALPENGMDRELIRGELREKPRTARNREPSWIEARLLHLLYKWLEQQPQPQGDLYSGEAGCRLRRDPDTTVGIDIAYLSAEMVARQTDDTTLIDGPPVLAVEIPSPSTREEEANDKVDEYLAAGVALVWLVDPHFQTVQVLRPGAVPERFNVSPELSGDPYLAGFRIPVAQIFSR